MQQMDMREHVDRNQLEEMEEHLIEQVQQMAGVDIDEIDDEEYERLQAMILESMTAYEELQAAVNEPLIEVVGNADDDLPEGEAARNVVRPA